MPLILSLIAASFTTFSFIPQAVQTIRTKNTSGISLSMYSMFTFGVLLWLIYGISVGDVAVASANGVTSIFAAVILIYKIKNIRSYKEK